MTMRMVKSEVMAMLGGYRAAPSWEIDNLDELMNTWPFLSTSRVKSEAEVSKMINGSWAFIYNSKSRPEISVHQ
ncbi:hypothetical protein N7455_011737 [Penicillium solitum]|uniref:uncharacterized protein n=1 Tax=Penicillium solitum TaxID=60172 RepID=UPI0032C3EE98|nr:hypothetical protein N7536_002858 [Penicillium majusculum]KAJ5847780.1 hypothetical protein N7455_011737 [Penicillium solitum]